MSDRHKVLLHLGFIQGNVDSVVNLILGTINLPAFCINIVFHIAAVLVMIIKKHACNRYFKMWGEMF